jgi:hypothetical protein
MANVVTASSTQPAQRAGEPAGVRGSSHTPSAMIRIKMGMAIHAGLRGGAGGRRAGVAGRSVGVPHRKHTIAFSAISVPQDRHFTAAPVIDSHHLHVKHRQRFVS